MSEEQQEKPTQSAVSTSDQDDDEKDDGSLDTPILCHKGACRRCCCSFNNYWKSLIWVSIIFMYLLLGGLFFSLAERPSELERAAEVDAANASLQAARVGFMATVRNDSNLTDEQIAQIMGIFQNFTAASERLNAAMEAAEVVQVWDFASAVFFCVTVITTIGYGNIAPTTGSGQTLFIFYALIGIPLALTFLATIGQILTDYLDAALKPILSHKRGKKNPVLFKGIGVLVFLSLALVFMIFIPAGIFYATEDWTYGQSIYYCFVTLTTVGFGDFVPAVAGASLRNSPLTGLYKIIVAVWLWIGLAFVAAIITELTNFIDAVSKKVHKAHCCGRGGAGSADLEKRELNEMPSPSSDAVQSVPVS